MIPNSPGIAQAVRAVFGDAVSVKARTSVSGGCINNAARLTLSNGEQVFLKENSDTQPKMFAAEADGLNALLAVTTCVSGPRVPEPLALGSEGGRQFILMEYIAPGRPGPHWAEEFGRGLALLHREGAETRFGLNADNFIGATPQINTWSSDWIAFYGERRLGFQLQLAKSRGLASAALVRSVEKVIERLDTLIPPDVTASLLHGDLWSGNAMADEQGNPVIIDPATYFGHFEAELAMTELFGRFPEKFYAAYHEILPIPDDYRRTRRTLYGLYHILNHLNLFGGGYGSQAKSMADALL